MTIEKAIHILLENYISIKDNVGIRKPVSFALYNTWKYADKYEKERPIKGKGAVNESSKTY